MSGVAFELDAGDGLVLRLNQPEHAGGIFALVDRDRDDLAHWLPWVDQTREVADSRAAIERSLEEFESGTAVALALVDDGRTVGKIGLHDIGEPEGNAELGYWLAADARGRGRMTRAARAMVGHAFETLGLRRVWLTCDARNTSSRAVAERLGMRLEGTFKQDRADSHGGYRDSVLYAVLANEWAQPTGGEKEVRGPARGSSQDRGRSRADVESRNGFDPLGFTLNAEAAIRETLTLRDGSVVTVRSPAPDDAEALLGYLGRVRRESHFLQFGPDDVLPTVEQEREWIASATSGPTSCQVLVEADGAAVALAGLAGRTACVKTAHRAVLGLSVCEDWQGRGLGRLLMEQLVAWARANPALDLLELLVQGSNNRARRLYASLGFVVDGEKPGSIRRAGGALVAEISMSLWVGGERGLGVPLALDAGAGLSLRAVRAGDAAELFALICGNRDHLRPWFRWPLTVETLGDVLAQIERWNRAEAATGAVTVLLRRGERLLGVVMLHGHRPEDRSVELGCWLDAEAQNRGDATRACGRVLNWAFETLGVARVEWVAGSDNRRSHALAQRLGFVQEGVRRGAQVWRDGTVRDLVVHVKRMEQPRNGLSADHAG